MMTSFRTSTKPAKHYCTTATLQCRHSESAQAGISWNISETCVVSSQQHCKYHVIVQCLTALLHHHGHQHVQVHFPTQKGQTEIAFTPSDKGLYKYMLGPNEKVESFWTLISTVAGQADKYTMHACI